MKSLTLRAILTITAAITFPASLVDAAEDPRELVILRQKFEGQKSLILGGIKKLNKSYLVALGRLESKSTDNGDLKSVIAVRDEMKRLQESPFSDTLIFENNLSENAHLRKMQETYLSARKAIEKEKTSEVASLAATYIKQLDELTVNLTKSRRIEDALAVTKEKEQINQRYLSGDSLTGEPTEQNDPVKVRAFLTAKAESEIFVNGESLHLRSYGPADNSGTNGKSPFFEVKAGDYIVIRSLGNAVFRSVALAFEMPDEERVLFFQSKDFKVVGQGKDVDQKKITREVIEAAPEVRPLPTVPDQFWIDIWEEHRLGDGGTFLKPEPQGQWVLWGSVITSEMLERGTH